MSDQRRRLVLEDLAYGAATPSEVKMRAFDALERLDGRGAGRVEVLHELDELADTVLDELGIALDAPVATFEDRVRREAEQIAREILADEERFGAEVAALA